MNLDHAMYMDVRFRSYFSMQVYASISSRDISIRDRDESHCGSARYFGKTSLVRFKKE
jgi:hypothetical protein